VQACFGFTLPSSGDNIRMNPDLGGGALLDAGSYALSLIRLAMGAAPVRVQAEASWADTGVDISMTATLSMPTDGVPSCRTPWMRPTTVAEPSWAAGGRSTPIS